MKDDEAGFGGGDRRAELLGGRVVAKDRANPRAARLGRPGRERIRREKHHGRDTREPAKDLERLRRRVRRQRQHDDGKSVVLETASELR